MPGFYIEDIMGEITDIKPQRRKGRFNIYVDFEFACGLSENTIVEEGLKIGQPLTSKEIEELQIKDQYSQATDYALRFLSFRPRSEKEVKEKLKKKGFDEFVISKVILKLQDSEYLDDEEFAKMWVLDRKSVKPEGSYLLKKELQQKGVAKEIIEKVLAENFTHKEEFNLALKVAQKKKKTLKGLSRLEFEQKITAALARRGFRWEIIKKVLKEL